MADPTKRLLELTTRVSHLEGELNEKNAIIDYYQATLEASNSEIVALKKRIMILENANEFGKSPFSPTAPPIEGNPFGGSGSGGISPFGGTGMNPFGGNGSGMVNPYGVNPLMNSGEYRTQELIKSILEEEKRNSGPQQDMDDETKRFIEEMLQNDKKALQEEYENKEYLCPICFDNFTTERMYVLDNCFHKYCRDCLTDMMTVKINEGIVTEIKCPDPSCETVIDHREICNLVDTNLFAKYEAFQLAEALGHIQDLRWCPKPDCGNAMIGSSDRPLMHCSNEQCRFTFCFNCKEEWHSDSTCEEYQAWKIENSEADARYAEWRSQNCKPCPQCTVDIEKNGGCNHMTCKHCNHEFCWLCFATYNSDHFSNTDCTQYS